MKKIGETKNFYVYTVTRDDATDGGILEVFVGDDSDEMLNQYLAAVRTDRGRKDLYNEWMSDSYEKDKIEAKNDPWLAYQLRCADRPLYFVAVKEDSQILTYENVYLVPAVIGDVECVAWGCGSSYYQVDMYDITETLFGSDHDAVWDIIDNWIDGGSINLDTKPRRIVSSPQDVKQVYRLINRHNIYELRWLNEHSGKEESGTFEIINDAVAVFAAATGDYIPEENYIEYAPEDMMDFYDESGELDARMCKSKALEELPDRGVTYLKNKTTGKVLFKEDLTESRRRSHRRKYVY